MFGFLGHHHGTPTLADRAAAMLHGVIAFVHGLPVGVWIAAIGAAAGLIGTVLNDRSVSRREAKVAARAERRAAARVKADLLVRLRAHCRRLDAGLSNGTLDPNAWQVAHDDLVRRARDSEVIDALGPSYVGFMEAVHRESAAIDAARASDVRPDTRGIVAGYEPFLRSFDEGVPQKIARV
jgi:hypothetical protein